MVRFIGRVQCSASFNYVKFYSMDGIDGEAISTIHDLSNEGNILFNGWFVENISNIYVGFINPGFLGDRLRRPGSAQANSM